MQSRQSSGREAMRVRKVLFAVAVIAAVMVGAQAAMAADPIPAKTCTTTNGWKIATSGLQYFSVGTMTSTTITYNITPLNGATPDHVATFVRKEAGVPTGASSLTVGAPCAGESVIGVAAGVICHERIARWNNQEKFTAFTLTVSGKREPIETSVVVRKGNSLGSCAIEGFGFEDTSAGSCVHQCGDFDEHQSVVKTEIFKFKMCEISFDFDTLTGEVVAFAATPIPPSNQPCSTKVTPVGQLTISGEGIDADSEIVSFGDGWISSGNDTCITRLISGTRYTTCF